MRPLGFKRSRSFLATNGSTVSMRMAGLLATHTCVPRHGPTSSSRMPAPAVLSQVKGPRFLAGDLNHDLGDLPALDLPFLKRDGSNCKPFSNIEGVTQFNPPAKGPLNVNFLFLSPELQPLVEDGRLIPDLFPDHTALAIGLRPRHQAVQAWPRPLPLPWDTAHTPTTPVPLAPLPHH